MVVRSAGYGCYERSEESSMATNGTVLLQALCDEELFMLFIGGDDRAYTAMYERYGARLLSYIYSILGAENRAAEDIFQETFLRLFRERAHYSQQAGSQHGGEPIRNIGGWLFRVGRNLSLNHIRSARYLTELPSIHDERLLVSVEEAHASIFADMPDEEKLLEAVRAVVETLPAGLREAFMLREVNGMSYEETAEIIGCSAEAARMRLSRARSAIRAALQSLFVDSDK
jgi:RNA polymerase sigma-70 factor, ECF subfamily